MRHKISILTLISISALLILYGCSKKDEPILKNDKAVGTVKDICGNTYNYVKIGEQYWMAENMRCNKYDTKSERAGATLSTEGGSTPYYMDASDKNIWESAKYAGNLTDKQISTLGYLYNWAAVVGIKSNNEQINKFNGNRQGICPNDWHVPTYEEWNILAKFIESTNVNSNEKTGTHLKATTGWFDKDNDYIPGLDTYGFAALPAGDADPTSIESVGEYNFFWTATPTFVYEGTSTHVKTAHLYGLSYDNEHLESNEDGARDFGRSVRCVKN